MWHLERLIVPKHASMKQHAGIQTVARVATPAGLRCRRRSQLRPTAARRPWEVGTVNGFKFTESSVAVRPPDVMLCVTKPSRATARILQLTPGCSVSAVLGAIGQVCTYIDHLQLPVF